MGFQTKGIENKSRYTKKYDVFNNHEDRKMIKEFDARYGRMGFFPTLVAKGLARFSTKYPEGAINEVLIEEVNDVTEKFKACNDLILLKEYEKNQVQLRLATL